MARLDEVCLKITDGSHRTPKLLEAGNPFLTVANIKDGRFDFSNVKYIGEKDYRDLVKNDCKPLKGDVLFSKDGTIGKVLEIKEDKDIVVLSSIAILRPNQDVLNSSYLAFIAGSDFITKQAIAMQSGSALRRIILRNLKTAKIPLPPLPIQHKIVEILEEADNLRNLRQQADEKMKDLIPSLFVQMFGDPVKNPKGCEVKKLGEITKIVSGSTPRTNNTDYWDGDILWVTPADLSKLDTIEIHDTARKITRAGYESCSTTMLPVGTVLLSSRAPIGHLAVAGKEICTNQGFKSLIPNQSIHSFYLYFVLKRFKDRLISLGSGASQSLFSLKFSSGSLLHIRQPLPPFLLLVRFPFVMQSSNS
jgi:type I restriction enzyme S subunit